MSSPSGTGTPARVLQLLGSAPPTLGRMRLLGIDGPAGSGKTTLAGQVAGLAEAPVVRMDDLYPGWTGLFAVDDVVLGLLEPLSRDVPGRYHRYDWATGAYAEEHVVAPTPLLVLEGVGAGNLAWASWITTLVWVEADDDLRLARGMARDGEGLREHWLAWMDDEARLFAREGTRARAHLVVRTGTA